MAASPNSPEATARTQTPTRKVTVPAPSKLRDSCHACASSKVKCLKEKPTCSRCAKRGVTCQYFVTKRAGRKHDSQSKASKSTKTNGDLHLHSTDWSAILSTSTEMDYMMSPNLIQRTPGVSTSTSSLESYLDLFTPADASLSSVFTALSSGFDEFFAPTMTYPPPDTSEPDPMSQSQSLSRESSGSRSAFDSDEAADVFAADDSLVSFEEAIFDLPQLSRPHPTPVSPGSPMTNTPQDHTLELWRDSECSCLVRALGILKQLSPITSKSCLILNADGNETTTTHIPTIKTVVAKNELTIEAVSKMLRCSCSDDGYLLTIMSLIVFKVLGWYAAAARGNPTKEGNQNPASTEPSGRHPSYTERVLQCPDVVGSYCLEGEDLERMAAQLVLSELHRVQQLVNQLSQKLKDFRTDTQQISTSANGEDRNHNLLVDGKTNSPFSTVMLDHLESDLRKRLRVLSLRIIEMLREEYI